MSSAEKDSSPDVASSSSDQWGSLYKLGAVSAILSAIFSVVWSVAPIYISSIPYSGTSYSNFLTFVWQHSTWYNLWFTGEALTVVFALPLILALYIVLGRVDKGIALIGASTLILGGLDYLSNVGTHFYLVQEAVTFNGGCTVCAQQAVTGALATGTASSADNIAGLLALAGVLILSLMMFKSKITGKVPGVVGLIFVLYSLLSAAIFAPSSSTTLIELSYLPTVFFGAWILVSGIKIFGAGKGSKAPLMQPAAPIN